MNTAQKDKGLAISDSDLLDWAETHPEAAMREIQAWWETCGEGGREVSFSFRNVIKGAMDHEHD